MTTTPTPSGARQPTPIDAVAEAHITAAAALHPLAATAIGLPGHEHEMTDFSPAGHDARADQTRSTLTALDGLAPVDAVDELTLAAMRERLGLELELHEAGEPLRDLNNIASPVQELRDVFDIMATGSIEDWENVAARLNALPGAVDGYVESLRLAASRGGVAAVRQVEEAARQATELADPASSFFTTFVTGADVDAALDESAACALVRGELERGAAAARQAYGTLATFLRDELAPQAPQQDAVGRDRYALFSRAFLGATVDLEETYRWGLEELARVVAEQEAVAAQVAGPGATIEQAVAVLDADPSRTLHGTDALRAWMQETSDAAIDALDGVHFAIPDALRTLECRIAPTQTGGIYYTGPSDDFTRPGRMWWSVPADVTTFSTWREKTTVYHEGVPGHHLQIGQAVHARDTLNRWRRLACWTSGFGEGWALYAERLMADLGFLDDPGDRLGMLDSQRLRAARVVFDIGVHLGLPAPAEWGGGTWDADKGWTFLRANVNMPESFVRFEWTRYLGWPGQAPSYKIGQRLWEQTRDAAAGAARTRGDAFDLRSFHATALEQGALPLDVLKQVFATS
ncbi:DUF885 domain-containing protein [Cellulomonas sp. H30R-01]|uniref:DUF885 domain-containing protein n=1 Tax=Cellulomonas sp. H30R-01 TaxID=2704467 RepID=UPI00138DB943|nr:DUF885 domain-containing protein [Cellulomonas sp. H30R-01]QHT54922.1 DUF885 domain-containing protein [Cellulomonas sp. H30R-01]